MRRGAGTARTGFARLAALAVAVSLAGCSTLLPKAIKQPPPKLYQVSAPALAPLPSAAAATLVVDAPFASQALDTNRIALKPNAIQIEYYADSRWDDRAPALIQTALVQAFENSAGVAAVGRPSLGLSADFVLKSELRDFEAVYDRLGAAPAVQVRLSVKLLRVRDNAIVAARLFEGRAPAREDKIAAAVQAFDAALGHVIAEIVPWSVAQMRAAGGPAQAARRSR